MSTHGSVEPPTERAPGRAGPKRSLEYTVAIVGSLEPAFALPQIIQLYSTRSGGDLSLETWAFGTLADLLFLYYGVRIRSLAVGLSAAMWVVVDAIIIVGILMYG